MSERFLTMLEVSQKQAYIFSSNKLKDNVINSATIAWIMSPEYFESVIADNGLFSKEKNLVYSGGGHTVLEFDCKENAVEFAKRVTRQIRQDYEGIEIFAKTIEYQEEKSPGANMQALTDALEAKKSIRASAFCQGSFGIEYIDSDTLRTKLSGKEKKKEIPQQEKDVETSLLPEGYKPADEFRYLGGEKGKSNFIAVVHIDGNAMGKRIEELHIKNPSHDWKEYKTMMRSFSEGIDKDFKSAYKAMVEVVKKAMEKEKLKELKLEEQKFPVRRIITAGDDICFVAEGRIGIECAVAFIKALKEQKNQEDGKSYAACAGVAIVHQKYPFYRAYELAEQLCSNAKKFGASLSEDGSGKDISAIDWHIEYGEMDDSLEDIRKNYVAMDGKSLIMRPYIVDATEEINRKERNRQYHNFKNLITKMQDKEHSYARGKLKELRPVLKQGELQTKHYLEFHKIQGLELESFCGISSMFDAIELIDTYISFIEKEESH